MSQDSRVHFDPKLVEEAVFHAQREHHRARDFEKTRNAIYEVSDADERERLFRELFLSWFQRFGLEQSIRQALDEQPIVRSLVANCYIVCAAQAKQEGAELFVASGGTSTEPRRTLRILLRPASLLTAAATLAFLRHELFHIADMLDPAFGYEPTLPKTEGGPTYDMLVVSRYRTLWDSAIAGRMMRRGWLPDSARDDQLKIFCQAFVMLGDAAESYFGHFFDGEQPKHGELSGFALDPRGAAGQLTGRTSAATHCPLCKFPTHAFEPAVENLGDEIITAVVTDFPHWKPEQGLCVQCADLYRASRLSMAAIKALPGWNHFGSVD